MSGSKAVPAYDNAGVFQYENESPYEEPPELPAQQPQVNVAQQQGIRTITPQLPPRDSKGKGRTLMRGESGASYIERECSPPLILTTEPSSLETSGKKKLEKINSGCDGAFAIVTFPFTCLIILLHHLLRFIIRGLLRPLVVDTVVLALEYFYRPLFNTLVRPAFNSLLGAAVSLTDIILILIKPVVVIFRSIRLVEINYVKNGSIQEV